MSVLFQEKSKTLELSVIGYEYPIKKGMDIYDANWLTVKICYSGGGNSAVYTDNCLLTKELESLINDIEDIISGKESGFITDFLEPYLKFSLTKVNEIYALQVRFAYNTYGKWKEIYIAQGLNKEELSTILDKLYSMSKKYPYRNVDE